MLANVSLEGQNVYCCSHWFLLLFQFLLFTLIRLSFYISAVVNIDDEIFSILEEANVTNMISHTWINKVFVIVIKHVWCLSGCTVFYFSFTR